MNGWRVPTGMGTLAGLLTGALFCTAVPVWGLALIGAVGAVLAMLSWVLPVRVLAVLALAFAAGAFRLADTPATLPSMDAVPVAGKIIRWDRHQTSIRILLRVHVVNAVRLATPAMVRVYADTSWGTSPASSWLAFNARIKSNRGATTPGGWTSPDLGATIYPERHALPRFGPGAPDLFLQARGMLRRHTEVVLSGFTRRLALAILLGDSGSLIPSERSVFRRTGASHLTAVSGLHIGLVAMLLGLLLGGAPKWARLIGIATGAWVYAGIAGWAASALRAATLVAAVSMGAALHRPRPSPSWLILALPWIVWSDTRLMTSISLHLSVGAVAGILMALEVVKPPRGRYQMLVGPVVVSLGAQWGTLPTVVRVFGALAPLATLPNLAVVPLAALFLPAVLLALGTSAIPYWGSLFVTTATGTAHLLWTVLEICDSRLPYWNFLVRPSWFAVAAFPLILIIWYGLPASRRALAPARGIAAVLMALAALGCFLSGPPPRGPWVAFLDVDQGDAAVVQLSDGTVWVVDVGDDRGPGDAVSRAVVPFLRHRRIRSVEGVIISHRHRDHVGALPTLLEEISVKHIYDAGYGSGGTSAWMDSVLCSRSLWPCLIAAGDTLHAWGGASLVAIHPVRGNPQGPVPGDNLNEASLIVELKDGPLRVLFAGDAEHLAEAACLDRIIEPGGVLKVGHHGSRTSSSEAFLDLVNPRIAVISCGEGNRFGHPSRQTLDRLEDRNIQVLRTDRDGTIVLSVVDGNVRLENYPPRTVR